MIREFKESDRPLIQALLSIQGAQYPFPIDQFSAIRIYADAEDKPLMVVAARPTVEVYFLIDQQWPEAPGMKFQEFMRLHESLRLELGKMGYRDVHLWSNCRGFVRKLKKYLGWMLSSGINGDWIGLTREVCDRKG